MSPKHTCNNCKFFRPPQKGIVGECRRNPPQVVVVNLQKQDIMTGKLVVQQETAARFPPTHMEGWCGEHQDAGMYWLAAPVDGQAAAKGN